MSSGIDDGKEAHLRPHEIVATEARRIIGPVSSSHPVIIIEKSLVKVLKAACAFATGTQISAERMTAPDKASQLLRYHVFIAVITAPIDEIDQDFIDLLVQASKLSLTIVFIAVGNPLDFIACKHSI